MNLLTIQKYNNFVGFSFDISKEELNQTLQIVTNTKELTQKKTFLAIKGKKFNALNFLDQVLAAGAKYVICEKNVENLNLIKEFESKLNFIFVKSSISFFQEYAKDLSLNLQESGGNVIAISGSNGKTTTRQILTHVANEIGVKNIATKENNNNQIGVPLSLNQIQEDTQLAIIELGSNHPGEIKALCECACPNVGITTNIGLTHLEFFNSEQDVYEEEAYLYTWMRLNNKESSFYQNSDDKYLSTINDKNIISYGEKSKNYKFTFHKNKLIIQKDHNSFEIECSALIGKHNLYNLGAAFVIMNNLYPDKELLILEALKSFSPQKNRSQWLEYNKKKVFLDAYNANPSSMYISAKAFVENQSEKSLKLGIIGDMNELGEMAKDYHEQTSARLSQLSFDHIIFVGKYRKSYSRKYDKSHASFETTTQLKEVFHELIKNYESVFIKGSRSLQLESLVDIT